MQGACELERSTRFRGLRSARGPAQGFCQMLRGLGCAQTLVLGPTRVPAVDRNVDGLPQLGPCSALSSRNAGCCRCLDQSRVLRRGTRATPAAHRGAHRRHHGLRLCPRGARGHLGALRCAARAPAPAAQRRRSGAHALVSGIEPSTVVPTVLQSRGGTRHASRQTRSKS